MLNMFRRRRIRTVSSLTAMAALVCFQILMAMHAGCSAPTMQFETHLTSSEHIDCPEQRDATDTMVCQSHCNQGDASPDASRIPPVPALGTDSSFSFDAVLHVGVRLGEDRHSGESFAWHRPTPHRASVLLI